MESILNWIVANPEAAGVLFALIVKGLFDAAIYVVKKLGLPEAAVYLEEAKGAAEGAAPYIKKALMNPGKYDLNIDKAVKQFAAKTKIMNEDQASVVVKSLASRGISTDINGVTVKLAPNGDVSVDATNTVKKIGKWIKKVL